MSPMLRPIFVLLISRYKIYFTTPIPCRKQENTDLQRLCTEDFKRENAEIWGPAWVIKDIENVTVPY